MKRAFSLMPILLILAACGTKGVTTSNTRQLGDPCDETYLCMDGLYCEDGLCRAICTNNSDCQLTEVCQNERCVKTGKPRENVSKECPEGFNGPDCTAITCQHGNKPASTPDTTQKTCLGDTCTQNDYYGQNCDKKVLCKIEHGGTPDNATSDDAGHCKAGTTCSAGWYGPDCNSQTSCDQEHGTPDNRLNGTANCTDCSTDYYGQNCDQKTKCTNGGTPNGGIDGDDKCQKDKPCADGWNGEYCTNKITCVHGQGTMPKNMPNVSDGNCAGDACSDGFYGPTCADTAVSCVNGLPDNSTTATADQCASCFEGWAGPLCDRPDDNHMLKGDRLYKTTKIGDQTWMAENMAYDGDDVECKYLDEEFYTTYGCLYKYSDAIKVCPAGWHLPSVSEYDILVQYITNKHALSGYDEAVKYLVADNTWNTDVHLGSYGFNALAAGFRSANNSYMNTGTGAHLATTTSLYYQGMGDQVDTYVKLEIQRTDYIKYWPTNATYEWDTIDNHFVSVRCLKDETMQDKAGKSYRTTKIGNQTWMAENMAYDGNDVECYYDQYSADYRDKFGCLYTWDDAKKVCPDGWKLPNTADISTLLSQIYTFGNNLTTLKALLAYDFIYSDNNSGVGGVHGPEMFNFSALPAGYSLADYHGNIYETWYFAYFWTASPDSSDTNKAYYMSIGTSKGYLIENAATSSRTKEDGLSVRCLKK